MFVTSICSILQRTVSLVFHLQKSMIIIAENCNRNVAVISDKQEGTHQYTSTNELTILLSFLLFCLVNSSKLCLCSVSTASIFLIRTVCPTTPAADSFSDRLSPEGWAKLMRGVENRRTQWCIPFLSSSHGFRDTGKKLFRPVSLSTKRQISDKRY